MKRSLHILADFYGCAGGGKYFTGKQAVRAKTIAVIRRAGFSIVASRFHKFQGDPLGSSAQVLPRKTWADEGGITGIIIVSESHLAIHTWPERRYVNLDIFLCNYSRDNSQKARAVFREFRRLFRPRRVRLREVWRD